MPLAWTSAVGVEGPWYYEPEGLGFFRTFGGGLLTTCGIDHALFMAEDTAAQYHYPPKQTETFGLHGRVSNRPARLVGYGERWDGDTCTLWAEGETLQATVFGEQLVLRRRIEAVVGESCLHIHDVVENVGHDVTPHMLLYHVNVGFPVVDEGSRAGRHRLGSDGRGATIPSRGTGRWWRRRQGTSSRCSSTISSRTAPATVGRRSSTGASEWGCTRSSGRSSYRTTSSGARSAREPTSSASSRARTAPPVGSTRASVAS